MKKKVPYAVANFEEIRRENYFFMDKTAFLEELENYKVPVFLRPEVAWTSSKLRLRPVPSVW